LAGRPQAALARPTASGADYLDGLAPSRATFSAQLQAQIAANEG